MVCTVLLSSVTLLLFGLIFALRYCYDVCSGATCHKGNEFQVAEMTIHPIYYNKKNCDHLIYEPQDPQ